MKNRYYLGKRSKKYRYQTVKVIRPWTKYFQVFRTAPFKFVGFTHKHPKQHDYDFLIKFRNPRMSGFCGWDSDRNIWACTKRQSYYSRKLSREIKCKKRAKDFWNRVLNRS